MILSGFTHKWYRLMCIGASICTHIDSKIVATLFFISAHEADLSIMVPRIIYIFHYTLNLTSLHTKMFFSLWTILESLPIIMHKLNNNGYIS